MFICLCLVTVTLMAAVYDPPGQPGKPEVIDWGRDYCTIKFTPPKKDGGSPIIGYRIGYRYKGDLWQTVYELVLSYEVKITGLIEGSEVEFRVSAVNKAGEGPPSDPSKMIIVKPR